MLSRRFLLLLLSVGCCLFRWPIVMTLAADDVMMLDADGGDENNNNDKYLFCLDETDKFIKNWNNAKNVQDDKFSSLQLVDTYAYSW